MADVKWIKITTDIFDDEKILMIEAMPSADSIIVIWFKLLAFAGKQNNDGVFMMSNRVAYTDEMLAAIFRREVNVIRLALNAFTQLGMIEIIDNVVTIPNWNKHQSLDSYEKKKERDRLYQAERRAKQRLLVEKSSDTSPDIAISDKEIDIDKDIEEENIIRAKTTKFIPPSVEEVADYCFERGNTVNPETFVDFYSAKGWMLGKNKMKDWKAAVRTWERKEKEQPSRLQKSNYVDSIKNRVTDVDNW